MEQGDFSSIFPTIDVLQRIYMRFTAYFSPIKDCNTVFGATLRCKTRDFVQRRIRFFGIFEHNLTYYTLEKLRVGDLYLDIGANVGYFTLLASRCVGSHGKVISIEANPAIFRSLKTNLVLSNCQNVVACNVAATAVACRVKIQHGELHNSGTDSIVIDADEGSVEGLPFRDLLGEDISRVRFIKIDIEGSEAPVLNAILDSLADLPTDVIVASEVSPSSADYVERFLAAGFQTYALQNIYTIDYYLIRSYMRRYGEAELVIKLPVIKYSPLYTDYVFER